MNERRIIAPEVAAYLDELVPIRPPEMQDMEQHADKTDFPIIGPASGYLCYQVARMIGAQRIFEMGSGFGYSTAWFARAVRENGGGVVHHTVWDAELSRRAREHLNTLGYSDLLRYHVDEAVQALKRVEGPFDLIFNDIDKKGYPAALPVISEKLRTGGVLIVDNLLWSGRIFDTTDDTPDTRGVREFTKAITTDPQWISSILPIRDGVLLAYKR